MKPNVIFFENNKQISEVFFDAVPIGTKAIKTITVRNTGDIELKNISFSIEHPDVKFVKTPSFLKPNNDDELIIEYTPITQTEEGIKSKPIEYRGVYIV